MNDLVSKHPEECAILRENARGQGRTDLAVQARKRAIEMRALDYGVTNQVERECLEAVYAYEFVLKEQKGRTTRAVRTWQRIKRHGIIGAVERAVNRPKETQGRRALADFGLRQYAFEAVILRHSHVFSAQAVERSRQRMVESHPPNTPLKRPATQEPTGVRAVPKFGRRKFKKRRQRSPQWQAVRLLAGVPG